MNCGRELNISLNQNIKVLIMQSQFDALVGFSYNVGDYLGAANEFERWNRAGGKVLVGLIKRREAEKECFWVKNYYRSILVLKYNYKNI